MFLYKNSYTRRSYGLNFRHFKGAKCDVFCMYFITGPILNILSEFVSLGNNISLEFFLFCQCKIEENFEFVMRGIKKVRNLIRNFYS